MKVAFIIPDKKIPWDSVHQGVGYVAAYAMQHFPVEDCAVFRTNSNSDTDLYEFLLKPWDVIGITMSGCCTIEVNSIVKTAKAVGKAKLVVGGAEVTTEEENIF